MWVQYISCQEDSLVSVFVLFFCLLINHFCIPKIFIEFKGKKKRDKDKKNSNVHNQNMKTRIFQADTFFQQAKSQQFASCAPFCITLSKVLDENSIEYISIIVANTREPKQNRVSVDSYDHIMKRTRACMELFSAFNS